MEKSFLFAHIATKDLDPDLGGQIKDALMTAIEKNEQSALLPREDVTFVPFCHGNVL